MLKMRRFDKKPAGKIKGAHSVSVKPIFLFCSLGPGFPPPHNRSKPLIKNKKKARTHLAEAVSHVSMQMQTSRHSSHCAGISPRPGRAQTRCEAASLPDRLDPAGPI